MAIYALADLHLPGGAEKPMDIFGPQWEDHVSRIAANWNALVSSEDLVIIAGDISWAMHLEEALPDLQWLANLRGQKLLLKGNHDYWWSAIGKVRSVLPPTVQAIQNDHFTWGERIVCGTRGWLCPGEEGFENDGDERIYLRELQRLELSLQSAAPAPGRSLIAALHFPPLNHKAEASGFTALLERYEVTSCVYGHVHGPGARRVFTGEKNGVNYYFVAADSVGFSPLLIE